MEPTDLTDKHKATEIKRLIVGRRPAMHSLMEQVMKAEDLSELHRVLDQLIKLLRRSQRKLQRIQAK